MYCRHSDFDRDGTILGHWRTGVREAVGGMVVRGLFFISRNSTKDLDHVRDNYKFPYLFENIVYLIKGKVAES